MAYDGSGLSLLKDTVGGGNAVWLYSSTDDAATVQGAGYITDATSRGLAAGDLVIHFRTGTVRAYIHKVASISSGAATLAGAEIYGGSNWQIGSATSALVAFFGSTPISQRANAALTGTISLFSLTGASFVANTSSTVSGLFGFNSTYASQLVDFVNEVRAMLLAYGLHKGGA